MAKYVWVFVDDDTTANVFTSAIKVVRYAMKSCEYENDKPLCQDSEEFELSAGGMESEPLTEKRLLEVVRAGDRAHLSSRSWTHYVSRERLY